MKNITGLAFLFCMAACSKEEFKATETPEERTGPTELIAFTRQNLNDNESAKIHVMHPDGSNVTIIGGGNFGVAGPAWSPDGRMIAYSDDRGIHTINMDDFKIKKIVDLFFEADSTLAASPGGPAWSPDGSYLAFVGAGNFCTGHGGCYSPFRIFIASLNSYGIRSTNPVVDSLMQLDLSPAWSPDGKKIVFTSDRAYYWDTLEANSDIYTMNPDGTEVIRLTETSFSEGGPVWSPDGKKIAFVAWGNGNASNSIYIMSAEGSDRFQVTHNLGHSPTWSPDGTRLAFVSDHDGNSEIYVVNIDGTGMIRLTNDSREDLYPAWSPGVNDGD